MQTGQQDQHGKTNAMPVAHDDNGRHGPRCALEPARTFDADETEQIIEQPQFRVVEPAPDDGRRHRQGDLRQKIDGAKKEHSPHLPVHEDRQPEGDKDTGWHGHKGVIGRIPQCLPEERIVKERSKILQANEDRRSRQTPISKCDIEGKTNGQQAKGQKAQEIGQDKEIAGNRFFPP